MLELPEWTLLLPDWLVIFVLVGVPYLTLVWVLNRVLTRRAAREKSEEEPPPPPQ